MDVLAFAQSLLRCQSVTPADGGTQGLLAAQLEALGFTVTRLRYGEIENLFAERPGAGAHLCFAGHTDVVPPGEGWGHDPFGGVVEGGMLYGRGAVDMKGAIAAFVAAAARAPGHVSLLITGDEEGVATDGTVRVLEWMAANGKIPDFCVVGEPTSRAVLGDVVKIGRRGSMNARITVTGRQGHVAYPHLADNPVHRLIAALGAMTAAPLDSGNEWFEPSSLQVTSVDVGNAASNVIPATASARLNVRFNNLHGSAGLTEWLRGILAEFAPANELQVQVSGEAFLTQAGLHTEALTRAIEKVTGVTPERNTGGGTSDARFIARYCPVAEFGLVGVSMHRTDEAVEVAALSRLADVYKTLIEDFCR
ncbi:succinyl-diaminopimelate desuccinylase [Acidocella aquatica]|uniref:Succinyl-diaminopimelate desuccinylase n=1 Tax=Acidocella aquatica TaxID=1922313 RepID=A0ABQ6A7Y5_9PROT|nr:succinyl-diaminopimelate desuccinylase [Acidocella aquatica]GLR66224.1 succinyl-diaminopimelate desuccinylase [Acidocella aquatica]